MKINFCYFFFRFNENEVIELQENSELTLNSNSINRNVNDLKAANQKLAEKYLLLNSSNKNNNELRHRAASKIQNKSNLE